MYKSSRYAIARAVGVKNISLHLLLWEKTPLQNVLTKRVNNQVSTAEKSDLTTRQQSVNRPSKHDLPYR